MNYSPYSSKTRALYIIIGCLLCALAAAVSLAIYFGVQNPVIDAVDKSTTTSKPPSQTPEQGTTYTSSTSTTTASTATTSTTPTNPIQDFARPGLRGALVDYVFRQDEPSVYEWTVYRRVNQTQRNVTSLVINFTSQYWMDESFSNHPLWYHNLILHIPDSISYPSSALLYITGGNNGGDVNLDSRYERRTAEYAAETGIPSALLRNVPNQPVIFENDGVGRREDDLIAWTWRRYYNDTYTNTQDPDILARWPMIKAVARAMDTVTAILKDEKELEIENYMLAGASKRGWTTWMAGAIDRRVVAMTPIVLSCLNMADNFMHYWQSFGGWPVAMFDYHFHELMHRLHSPRMGEVIYYVDPYEYRHWMNIPKFVINGASDEFFLLDDFDYFYDNLPGESHMWIVENSGHSVYSTGPLADDVWRGMQTFHLSILQSFEIPTFTFERGTNITGGWIRVTTNQPPKLISAWAAFSNPPLTGNTWRRDWRLSVLNGTTTHETGILWNETAMVDLGNENYEVYYENPTDGYLAFFVKVVFDAFDGRDHFASTKAQIIPNIFPFPACEGDNCMGSLV